jgi:hypothetical protein
MMTQTTLNRAEMLAKAIRTAKETKTPIAFVHDPIGNAEESTFYNYCPVSAVPILFRFGTVEAIVSADGTVSYGKAPMLATTFAGKLREALTPWDMADTVLRNSIENDHRICHSHDFCDANVCMLEAFTTVMGCEMVLGFEDNASHEVKDASDYHTDLSNAAWSIAKANGFWFLQQFDGFEVGPCHCANPDDDHTKETQDLEPCHCEPQERQLPGHIVCWSVWGHYPSRGLECIRDFDTDTEPTPEASADTYATTLERARLGFTSAV